MANKKLFALTNYLEYPGLCSGSPDSELVALAYLCAGDLNHAVTYEQNALEHFTAQCPEWYKRRWITHSLQANLIKDTGFEQHVEQLFIEPRVGQAFTYANPTILSAVEKAYSRFQAPVLRCQPLCSREHWIP